VQPGEVSLDVLDARGVVTATAAVDSTAVVNNAEQSFPLPAPACADRNDRAVLRLRFQPRAPGAMIAAWHAPAQRQPGFWFRTLYNQPADFGLLRLVSEDRAAGVRIWANPRAAPRAFLAPAVEVVRDSDHAFARLHATKDLQRRVYIEQAACRGTPDFPATSEPGRLLSLRVLPNRVEVRYDARTPGVLTLTDAYADGWTATLDGRAAPVLRVDGVFRGVCVDAAGEHRVEFTYRPPHWSVALGTAGVGMLGLVVLTLTPRRNDRTRRRKDLTRRRKDAEDSTA